MEIKIINKNLLGFGSWLNELQLPAVESRHRSRFVQRLQGELTTVEKTKKETAKKYAKLDEKGEPVIVDNHWEIPDDKMSDFSKEINDLLNDTTSFILTKDEYQVLKRTVLSPKYVFGPSQEDSQMEKQAKIRQANEYSEWCQVFEQ